MASSRCPNCSRWIPPGGESCNCHARIGSNGYPSEGSVALMTANLVKPMADRLEKPGEYRRAHRSIEQVSEARWQAENRGADYQGEGGGLVNSGAVGGVLAMLVAVLWFFAGIIYLDVIYFYPPILFVFGLAAVLKGVMGKMK